MRRLPSGRPFRCAIRDLAQACVYVGFHPAFVDVTRMTVADVVAVVVRALFTVTAAKLGYAYAAYRAGALIGKRMGVVLNRMGGSIMIVAGVLLVLRRP